MLSILDPALRYKVLSYDQETRRAVLQGKERRFEMGQFTNERLQQQGYRLVYEADLPPMPEPKDCCPDTPRACGGTKCRGVLCPPAMWVTCLRRGGRWTVN